MSYCPSQDWDRLCNEEDRAAAAETAFYRENKEAILKVLCVLLTVRNNIAPMSPGVLDDMVEEAARIVSAVHYRGDPPE